MEQLDTQIMQMQEYDEKVQEVSNGVAAVKEEVKERAKEVERVRLRRAEVEKEVREKRGDVEIDDGVAVALYDW